MVLFIGGKVFMIEEIVVTGFYYRVDVKLI